MKNFWLDKKEAREQEFSHLMQKVCIDSNSEFDFGFTMNDEYSLMQYSSASANLDFFYNNQFVSNEILEIYKNEIIGNTGCTTYLTSYTPILDGSMTGIIEFDEANGYSFIVNSNGIFDFKRLNAKEDNLTLYYDEVYDSCSLNLNTGELKIDWHSSHTPKVTVSYEYKIG